MGPPKLLEGILVPRIEKLAVVCRGQEGDLLNTSEMSVTAISWSSFDLSVQSHWRLVSLVVAKTLIFPLVTFFCISNNLKTFQLELILVFGKKDEYF